MDMLLLGLLVADLYFIVFCRLMINASRSDAPQPGLFVVLSMPSRNGLGSSGSKYFRRYWLGIAALPILSGLLLLRRYPQIEAAFSAAA